jgi:hypothetical protein
VHVELAFQHGVTTPFYRGRFAFEPLELPEEHSREDDWIPQLVAGAALARH